MTSYNETLHQVLTSTIIHAKSCGFAVRGVDTTFELKKGLTTLRLEIDFRGDLYVQLHAVSPSVDEIMVVSTALDRVGSLKFLCPPGNLKELHEGAFERALKDLGQ